MTRRGRGAAAAVLFGLLACGPRAGEGGAGGTEEPGARAGASALAARVGQVLALTVPLAGGGQRELAEMRGKPVLLELSDATTSGREATQGRWRALVERTGEGVEVVCVALDAEASALPSAWVDDPPPFVLGWDPQGALAARLQLRALPTVVLLDAAGKIVAVFEGEVPDDAAIDQWLWGHAELTAS